MKSVMDWLKRISPSDKRKAQRLKAPLLVAYYWDGAAPMAHEVQNISLTGFYLLTKDRWQLGTMVTMTLQRTKSVHESADKHYIAVMSKVVRLGVDGVGFVFLPVEDQNSNQAQGQKSRLAGKKTIESFLEQLKSDRSHAIIESIETVLKRKLLGRNSDSSIPGRESYEDTEG